MILVASRSNPVIRSFYERLLAAGKLPKVASLPPCEGFSPSVCGHQDYLAFLTAFLLRVIAG